jgi:nucleolar protein 9
MKSLFTDNKGKQREDMRRTVPAEFTAMARRFIEQLRSGLSGNEVRAMAASKVASPCLKVCSEASFLLNPELNVLSGYSWC